MGQSLSLTAQPGGSAGIDVPELSDLTYEKSLGMARLMKCVRARHQDGLVVVKVVTKPLPTVELTNYVTAIRSERNRLTDVANALGYQRVFETSTNGYLLRQYFYSSLYDRLSTRPFLEDIEKRWLAYQLLCAVRDSHARDVYHGDIKTENIFVTSWNWLYLTDYSASYKPTHLPEDNPADFSYYFDTSGRRTCYLAPERFLSATEQEDGQAVTWAMDVFSAGCVIAELFTEAPIFNLSQLFKYRKSPPEYDPKHGYLSKIQDEDVRELVSHMIQVQPESRYSAEEYLNFWRKRAFPEYFYSFLHQYMGSITDPSAGRASVHPENLNFGEADERIDKIYYDFDKIAYFLGYDLGLTQPDVESDLSVASDQMLPLQIDIPNNRHEAAASRVQSVDDGSLIFLTLLESSLRHTARSSSRVRACDLMLALAERVTDEAKLDRILPYLIALLSDRVDGVKVAALRAVAQLLAMIRTVSPVNAYAFTEYIKPRLQQFTWGLGPKASTLARATYASCLASLAHSSSKMIDMVQALQADGSIPNVGADTEDGIATTLSNQTSFDNAKVDLLELFETHTKDLLTDKQASVRRALLSSVSSLCVFFGNARANDVVLSHLNTYLNDKDWILKCAFFRTIVGVASFIGGPALEVFILPLMLQSLNDVEEFVVREVLSSFASMAELGLFQRSSSWELVDICGRYMVHPNAWVREAAVHFVAASTRFVSVADRHCLIAPLIQPFMKAPLADFSALSILDSLKKPLPGPVMDMALKWAANTKKGLFWKPNQQQRTFSFSSSGLSLPLISLRDLRPGSLAGVEKTQEDEQWIKRLQETGMTVNDEPKLLALREYILRISSQRAELAKDTRATKLENMVALREIHVNVQTVFFEPETKARGHRRAPHGRDGSVSRQKKVENHSHTIADALLDASNTATNQLTLRRMSHLNARAGVVKGTMPRSLPHMEQASLEAQTRSPSSLPPSKGSRDHIQQLPDIIKADKLRPDGLDQVGSNVTTPTVSSRAPSVLDKPKLRHQSSAIQLLNRQDTSKTAAETGTNISNATGIVEGLFHDRGSPSFMKGVPSASEGEDADSRPVNIGHSYTGQDPTVRRLLDTLASENYPRDIVDFGPLVTPVSKRHSRETANGRQGQQRWKPLGTLVATFGEHTGAITRVLPSPDHKFFITASDDGTIKAWDTVRLERNLTHRSRLTFVVSPDSQVKALVFIENTHTFASAATDGSIKVVKLDHTMVGEGPKYGRPRIMREHQLQRGEYALWLDHAKIETSSLLLVATNTSRILALDLRSMTELYVLLNPVHHGTITCFCADHKQGWLVVGTSHGVIDLWDMRFQLRLKAWSLAGGKPIHRITASPFHPNERKICVTGGTGQTDVTIWDIEKGECSEVFRAGVSRDTNKNSIKPYEAWKVNEDKPEGMLGRFATAIDPSSEGINKHDIGVRGLVVGVDESDEAKSNGLSGFLLTGGVDKKVRYWDYSSPPSSMVVSGLEAEEPQPKYTTTHPSTSLSMHTERVSQQSSDVSNKAKRWSKQPRNTAISLQQQTLLKGHLDVITDVCLLEHPVRMAVSVDRMGCVHVFQ